MNYYSILIYSLIFGISVICLIATVGAVASRKLNFNYAYLSILSVSLYGILGFEICSNADFKSAIIVNSLLALFDSTIGFMLSIKCESNSGYTKEQSLKMIRSKTTISLIIYALILTLAGYGLSSI